MNEFSNRTMFRNLVRALALVAGIAASCAAERPLDRTNSWAFSSPEDAFTAEALLDLRALNEDRSGQSGFIQLSADHNDFVRGDGEPIRFWAVGSDGWKFSPEDMDTHLRWLAKLGVNLVRLHVDVVEKDGGILDVDEQVISGCHRLIKAAKDNGIYVLISPYYPHFDAPLEWGLEGGKQRTTGLLFFNPDLQDAYKHWTREFYTRINPHTKLAIKDDPTVAILQIHNEDSLFFWTQQAISDPQKKLLGKLFGDWLAKKYGSLGKAFAAWGDKARNHADDLVGSGVAGIFDVYFLTQDWKGDTARRIRDQTEFFARLQRQFYAGMGSFLRDEVGCKQLLNASNWRTANDARLKALERFSYAALDIDAENEYVGSDYQHKGKHDGYRIDPGDFLVNESVLSKPFEMCTNWKQEDGHPFIVTETAWKNPNRYQAEGPFLAAAYQSLGGIDAVCWFSCQTPRYETDPLKPFWRIGDQMATHKWNHCYPTMMAGFPANALLFRRRHLKQAAPAIVETRSLEAMFARTPPRITDNETYGDARDQPELDPGWKPQAGEVNRVAYQIGPVVGKTSKLKDTVKSAPLDDLFDPDKGTILSGTRELLWDYRRELCRMDSPMAQGVTGFLKRAGGRFKFADVTIESDNEYAAINVVSLDDLPLATSARVLVQVVTENRLTGWLTRDAKFTVGKGKAAYEVEGEQIVRTGEPPFRIANTQVTISLKNPQLTTVTFLDINGYPIATEPIARSRVPLRKDTIYAILHVN